MADPRFTRTRPRTEITQTEISSHLEELHRSLSWGAIEDFLWNINENTWELSRCFRIHPASVIGLRRRLCEERFVARYEVQEYIERKMLDERLAFAENEKEKHTDNCQSAEDEEG